jgi:glycosyltransferase involved in cell wall biosynthesis
MPVVEAMACGTPVIATRSSSIPEAGGDAALYFEPNNVDSLVQMLTAVLNNQQLAAQMSENGLSQAKRFSWKRAGEETAEVYRRIINDQ